MFPKENFDKRWTMIVVLPRRKQRKASLTDDEELSLLSGGTGSVVSGMDTLMGGEGGSMIGDDELMGPAPNNMKDPPNKPSKI